MINKIIKSILGLSMCASTLPIICVTSCGKNTPAIDTGPSIDEIQKTQIFEKRKIVFDFIWNGWRPKNNKFDDVKLAITSQQGEVELTVTNWSDISPDKKFSVEISITNTTLPVYSENIIFNIEFYCEINSKKQEFVAKDFIGMYVPNKVIVEPQNKTYDMISDMNTQESYTTTDEFILADTDITPTDLKIQIGQVTGETLGNIFVDVHASGQKFYLRISTKEFNPRGNKYQLSLQISYNDVKLYDSTDYYLIFKPQIIEQEKTMRCFPVDGQTNSWIATEDMYLLHAPSSEIPENYSVELNKPDEWIIKSAIFQKSGSFKTDYSLYVEFDIPTVTQYKSWDVEVTIKYVFLGETYVILNKSVYTFYTAPAIDASDMSVNHQVVTEGTPHSEAIASDLNWTDRFGLDFDILDTPEITTTKGDWPDDIIQPVEAIIIPSTDPSRLNYFGVTVRFYRTNNQPLDIGYYEFKMKFKMKNIHTNQKITDEVQCILLVE